MSLTPEEKQKRKEERKIKRALKIARLRPLKNFGWWLFGLISSVFITIGIIAICVFVVPINTVTGNSTDRYVKEEISSKSLYSAFMAFNEGNYTADQVLYIDNIINDVENEQVKTILQTLVDDEVRNTPLTSGGSSIVDAMMKNARNLEAVKTVKMLVGDDVAIINQLEGILGSTTIGTLMDGTFDFNGVKLSAIAEIANLNLDDLKIGDQQLSDIVFNTIIEDENIAEDQKPATKDDITIGNLTSMNTENMLNSISLNSFMEETPDNSKIYSVLRTLADKESGEIYIGDLLSIDNDRVNAIKISSVAELDEHLKKVLYSGLDEESKPATADDITIGDLSNLNFELIKLNDVATFDPDMLEMLHAALDDSKYSADNPKPDKNNITVGDLANLNKGSVTLGTVLVRSENENLYTILDGALGENSENKTLSDLSSFSVGNITLGTVLKRSENENLYTILDGALGENSENKTLSDLSSFDVKNITLGTVFKKTENANIYKILDEVFDGDASVKKISDLSDFDIKKVKLGTVLEREENADFYKVLDEVFGENSQNKKVSELNDFDLTRVHFSVVLDVPTAENGNKNKTIYDVLLQATGSSKYEDIKLSDLSGSGFDINNVKLDAIMSKGDNKTVNALLDSGATVGTIGEKLNSLSLYDIYGADCFTKTPHGTQRFTLSKDENGKNVYTASSEGEYYISENAGIWLLVCFDSEKNTDGKIIKYTESDLTINSLSTGSTISNKLTNATINQLIAANIVDDPNFNNTEYYDYTLVSILEIVATIPA